MMVLQIESLNLNIKERDEKIRQLIEISDGLKSVLSQREKDCSDLRQTLSESEISFKSQSERLLKDLESQRRKFIVGNIEFLQDIYTNLK